MHDKAHEQRIDVWLRAEGLSRAALAWADAELLHAVRVARRLLDHSVVLLDAGQQSQLAGFVRRSHNRRLRGAISKAEIYAVLTLGKKINRHTYRHNRASKRR